jgi:hypothetical protein
MKVHPRFVARRLNAPPEQAASALSDLAGIWSGRARIGDAGVLTGLSPAETAAHLAPCYTGEVGNGGHAQYYMNQWGSHAHETLLALAQLGLPEPARILQESFQVFPNQQVPKGRAVRYALIGALGGEQLALLDGCDKALWANAIDAEILRYLRHHQDQVLAPEQA